MRFTLAKALAGLGVVGVFGLGIYGIYSSASKTSYKTIAQMLKEEGRVLLSFDDGADSSIWNSKFESFSAEGSNEHKLGNFAKDISQS